MKKIFVDWGATMFEKMQRYCIPLVIVISLVVQLLAVRLFTIVEPRSYPDDYVHRYKPQAETILNGGGLLLRGEAPSPPGYPLALAFIIALTRPVGVETDTAALLLNIIMLALAAGLLTAATRRMLGVRIGLFSGFIFATYPFAVYLGQILGQDTPYLFMLAFTVWLAVATEGRTPLWAAAVGAMAGFSMLVKPMGILLPFFYAGTYLINGHKGLKIKTRLIRPTLVLIASALTILPWQIYVSKNANTPVFLSNIGSGAIMAGWTNGLRTGEGGDRVRMPDDVLALMAQIKRAGQGASASKTCRVIALAGLARPAAFAKLVLQKVVRPWYGTDEMWHEKKIAGIQALYILAAAAGLVIWLRRKSGATLLAYLIMLTLCHWLMAFATSSILRFMLPASFLLAVCIGILIDRITPIQQTLVHDG